MLSYFVHPTTVVDKGAKIGCGSKVWHFSHISDAATIGANVTIGQNVYVGSGVRIGDKCKIQNNVSVYENVTLEEGVFCGPSMVFTNVNNPRALIDRKKEFSTTLAKRGSTFGANCTIICGITIGEYAFIAAGAVVTRNVKDYALMIGTPAKQVGWISQFGEKIHLPLHGSGRFTCPNTGVIYQLIDDELYIVKES